MTDGVVCTQQGRGSVILSVKLLFMDFFKGKRGSDRTNP